MIMMTHLVLVHSAYFYVDSRKAYEGAQVTIQYSLCTVSSGQFYAIEE